MAKMRNLTKSELLEIKEDLFTGRQTSIEVEGFTSEEFNRQLRELEEKEKTKDDASAKVGRRSTSSEE